jgi:hypothetical protein
MLNVIKKKFEIKGVPSVVEDFQDMPTDINKLLESYSEGDKAQLTDKLALLEKQNNKAFKKILPQGVMPVYLSPLDPETEVLQTATWTQYSDVGPYAEFDDSYCRPDLANKNSYVYPRRNPDTQEIELSSCDKLINTDIKEMANLSQYLTTFNDLAKVKLLELNSNDVNSSVRFKTDINKKLDEYNKLHDQYIQLSNLLQTNIDLINKRKKIIDTQRDNVDSAENDYNIKREIVGDDMQNTRDREKLLVQSRIALKAFGVLLILITVGLVLLIDIGKVL